MNDRGRIIGMAAVVALAAIIFGTAAAHTFFYSDPAGPSSPAGAVPVPARGNTVNGGVNATSTEPSRLIIPSLNINANVQYVGVNAQGNMRAPSNFTDVTWYEPGTVPGFTGSAVMAGHVDNGLGLAGVFKHLADLKAGDDIYVRTKGGTQLHFVVSDVQAYPHDAVPVDALFTQSDAARLNLVTCEGAWISGQDTYDHRLVIYSKLVQ